ncbi:MAG: hypothetical protein WCS85_05400 [Candidatus Peribacteraceae bacterium]|jgi:hypothetical protein
MPRILLRARRGFLILEAVLAIGIFTIFLAASGGLLLQGQERTSWAGDRVRGAYAAFSALEGARSIRSGGFSSLPAGTHGVVLGPSGSWILAGSGNTANNITTTLTIADVESNHKTLRAEASWPRGADGSGSLVLEGEVTDWREVHGVGDWSQPQLLGSAELGGQPAFTSLALKGTIAYVGVASDPGLLLFDVSDPSSPSRTSTSFTVGVGAHAVAVRGDRLYVLTDDTAAELRMYNITTPASPVLTPIASYNLPGSDRGLSLSFGGNLLIVGAKADATEQQMYLFDAFDTSAFTLLGSLHGSGDVYAAGSHGTTAYLATGNVAAELGVVGISSPALPVFASGEGYNVTGSLTGLSIAVTGSSAVLGQAKGMSNVVVFDVSAGGMPSAPRYHQGSGSIVGVGSEPSGCFAFLAAASGHKALQVVRLSDPSLPEVASYSASSLVPATALLYDPGEDRLYLLTASSLRVLRSGTSPSPCL